MWVFLAGCSTSDPVYLRHPQTGKKVQCGPYMNAGIWGLQSAKRRERDCIVDYQRQGYELDITIGEDAEGHGGELVK